LHGGLLPVLGRATNLDFYLQRVNMSEQDATPAKLISCFDGLVPLQTRSQILQYLYNSKYKIGWADVAYGKNSVYRSIHSPFTPQEVHDCGLGNIIDTTSQIADLLVGYEYSNCMVNLSVPMDPNFTHTHPHGQRIVLYYANPEWESAWYGETLFFNDSDTEIIYTVRYTPGRIVVFDGDIPHSIRPQSLIGPQFRFTVAVIYTKVKC
jgi:hypothetical protein